MQNDRDLLPSLALALLVALPLATATGCHGHDHDHDGAAETPRSSLLREQEAAADSIVSMTRVYLEGREKNPAAPAPRSDIVPRDAALDALVEAGKADHACDLAERIADAGVIDQVREARLRSSSALVRRCVAVVAKQASEVGRSGQGLPVLKTDLDHLRASLRALKVELFVIQSEVEHDD